MNNNDPRSLYYARVYNKTPINFLKFLIILTIYVLFCIAFKIIRLNNIYLVFLSVTYIILNFKNLVILLIKIYQHTAPISIRSKCRFEPSCSNYMLICLKKYGLICGLKKGVKRLKRCNVSDGGYDYP